MRILGISGSLQRESANRKLLQRARELLPPDVELVIYEGLRDLPFFDPDLAAAGSPPPVVALREALSSSDALLIASPEYGHSLPGSLKNAIDWVIGTGELEGKIVAITASTPAAERGRKGLDALAVTLGAVSARIVGGVPIARGAGSDEKLQALLDALLRTVREAGDRAD